MTGHLSNERHCHSLLLLFLALVLISRAFPRPYCFQNGHASEIALPSHAGQTLQLCPCPCRPHPGGRSWGCVSRRHMSLGGICLVIQEGLSLFLDFSDKIVRLWVLRPSVEGGAQEEVSGGDAVLDGAGGDIPPALRHRGEHGGAWRAPPTPTRSGSFPSGVPWSTPPEPCEERTARMRLHACAKELVCPRVRHHALF